MTEMRRVTITVPDNIDQMVLELRKEDRFIRCSYSEIVRQILDIGLKAYAKERVSEVR